MAPVRTPGRKRREADYSAVGRHGRKTGVTVPDLGPRDEHGLEPVEGLFSSPAKAVSPNNHGDAQMSGEDMEIVSSSQIGASHLTTSVQQAKPLLPRSRSPIRTKLGTSPRRSVGGFGSKISELQDALDEDVEISFFSRPKVSAYEFPESVPRASSNDEQLGEQPATSRTTYTEKFVSPQKVFDFMYEGMNGDDFSVGGENIQYSDDLLADIAVAVDQGQIESSVESESEAYDGTQEEGSSRAHEHPATTTRRNHKRKSEEHSHQVKRTNSIEGSGATRAERSETNTKKNFIAPHILHEQEVAEKPRRVTSVDTQATGRLPLRDKKRKLKRRGASTRAKSVASHGKLSRATTHDLATTKGTASHKSSRQNPFDLHVNTQSKESADKHMISAPVVLRSGRTSVKPLAFWRGERILYEPSGGYLGVDPGAPAAEVKERVRGRTRTGRKRRVNESIHEPSETEDQPDEWEIDAETPGILMADLLSWDPKTQKSIEDVHEEIELALAPAALDERTQWDRQQTFKFGKTLTLPFFHSGVVDLPPGGEKRPKNSRKNHMIFWVFSGRVLVEVSGNTFSVRRGGMWQVPRGNSYGLSNPFDKDARIFFAQGCYMERPEDESALMSGAVASAESLSSIVNNI